MLHVQVSGAGYRSWQQGLILWKTLFAVGLVLSALTRPVVVITFNNQLEALLSKWDLNGNMLPGGGSNDESLSVGSGSPPKILFAERSARETLSFFRSFEHQQTTKWEKANKDSELHFVFQFTFLEQIINSDDTKHQVQK